MWKLLYTESLDFPFPEGFEARAQELGVSLVTTEGYEREELRHAGRDCDGAFLLHAVVDDGLLESWERCQVLARVGTGYDKIDVQAARRRGIEVTYVPDFCTDELSDTALLFILALARQLPTLIRPGSTGRWRPLREIPTPHRLRGRSLAILGFGTSGEMLARKIQPFGVELMAWSRTAKPALFAELGVEFVPFEKALTADIVSVHLPLTSATRRLLCYEAFEQFSPGSWLINIARGEIVQTDALVEALRTGRLAGAGLDVTDPEPLPDDHPLWSFENVIITPHCAALSAQALQTSFMTALEDAVAVLDGRDPRFPVPATG